VSGISRAALDALAAYDWPGNVRELQNAVERAVLVCKGAEVRPEDLPLRLADAAAEGQAQSLAEVERLHVKRVLEEAGWNVHRAARLLGIDRVTLYNKIKKYGFKREAASV
jgi:DNA-binding NtrC family response regulator